MLIIWQCLNSYSIIPGAQAIIVLKSVLNAISTVYWDTNGSRSHPQSAALDEGPTIYTQVCTDAGIKPIYHPFWEGLPYTNIYRTISPDILHQLYQGVVKHLIAWVTAAAVKPRITSLSRAIGTEHDQISRFLLSLVIDTQLPYGHSSSKLVGTVRTLLDFVYLVQTTDNYNTEYTERLHIDLAKEAYCSTNFKDEFPQMTLWLEHKEKIYRHENYIQWRLNGCPSPPIIEDIYPGIVFECQLKMTKHPTLKSVRMSRLVTDYGATLFRDGPPYLCYVVLA
ncbi:hypothetical protein DFH08DRAFT_959895 [Mycena albidolilacea]|uniref:Uncharacterized protein n=1 Tax=Mycena albidolilacea TaxID=1033008 RepID=A0AAD7ERU4_9AGAR|nr:hypothetical protein DFH08DRAFT_959895 [Mycena albidolilacea]